MGTDGNDIPLSAAQIPADDFADMRRENLARWPTGTEVDLDEAIEFHQSLPKHKQLGWVMRKAAAEGRFVHVYVDNTDPARPVTPMPDVIRAAVAPLVRGEEPS